MVLWKLWQVIMASSNNSDKCDLPGIDRLQLFAVTYGDQPIFGTVQYIRMAIHMSDPFVGAQVKPQ